MAFTKYIISLLLIPTLLCSTLSAQQKKFREKASGEKVLPTEEIRSDRNKEDYLLEGIRYYNMRNPELAKANFLKLLEKDPSNDAAYFYLSNISLMAQDLVSGEVLLKKALALDSANYWYNDLLARLYLRTGRPEEAIQTYEKLISLYPKKTDIYYALADLYMNKQDIGNSVRTLDKIERIAGKSEAVGLARFNLYRIQQDWEGALKYLIEFDKEFQSARIETLIGDMYADRYRDTLAMKYYARALETEPSYAPAQFGQAEIHRMHREYNLFFEKPLRQSADETGISDAAAPVPPVHSEFQTSGGYSHGGPRNRASQGLHHHDADSRLSQRIRRQGKKQEDPAR